MTKPDLFGRTAIVTGAAGGLGSAMARALAGCGANVVLLDLDKARLEGAAAALTEIYGARVYAHCADISVPEQTAAAVAFARKIAGSLDILVNNAAIGPTALENSPQTKSLKFWESDERLWRRSIEVNVNGTFLMARAAAPEMIANGWGRIVNISTSLSTMQRMGTSPYGVSKAAIEAETQIWAKDLEGAGVTVNTLLPGGAVDTDFVSGATRVAAREGKVKLLTPDVMVAPLLFLVSRESDVVSGQRFVASRWTVAPGEAFDASEAQESAFAIQQRKR